jgi:ankyrin repeat protein
MTRTRSWIYTGLALLGIVALVVAALWAVPFVEFYFSTGDMQRAAAEGRYGYVRAYLLMGNDINSFSKQGYDTALGEAAGAGRLDMMRWLMDQGADVNAGAPLRSAIYGGQVEAVAFLLGQGADPNVRVNSRNVALHEAAGNTHVDTVAMLELLIEHGAKLEVAGWYGQTPLHVAADRGNLSAVRYLVERGANVNAMNADGDSSLTGASRHPEVVAYLRAQGAKVHNLHTAVLLDDRDAIRTHVHGVTAQDLAKELDWAVKRSSIETLEVLLSMQPDLTGLQGQDALRVALAKGKADMFRLLWEHGARLNPENPDVQGTLYDARQRQHADALVVYAELTGADPDG